MKKIFYSAIALTVFSLAIILFQISCQKDATAKTSSPAQNKFLYYIVNGGVTPNIHQYWISNVDGTNRQQIPITMPSGFILGGHGKLTVDGSTLIFTGYNLSDFSGAIFSVSVNGGTALKLFDTVPTNTGETQVEQTF